MIYVTGDTHGDIGCFKPDSADYRADEQKLTADDTLIICGDFGFVFHTAPDYARIKSLGDEKAEREVYRELMKNKQSYFCDEQSLDYLANKPYTIAFALGNHENYDRLFSSEFEKVDYCGGTAIKIRDNIFALLNGEKYVISGKSVFVFGGALSADKARRKAYEAGFDYKIHWDAELPTNDDYKNADKTIKNNSGSFDYIITHQAPQNMIYKLGFRPAQDTELTNYLQWLYESLHFNHWYFGHFHTDSDIADNITCCYKKILRIEV